MQYVKTIWTQIGESSSEQVVTYSELGPDKWETRKIEFLPTGQVGIATQAFETTDPDVGLAEVAYPELEEINAASGESDIFEACYISAVEFDELWTKFGEPLLLKNEGRHFRDGQLIRE